MGAYLSRLKFDLAMCAIAAAIAVIAFAFLAIALYFALARITTPAIAALATGIAALAAAALVAAIGRFGGPPRERRTPPPPAGGDGGADRDLALEMGEILGRQTSEWARAHPFGATGIAIVAGFAVGASPGLRRALRDALR